jgi:hypothetical protein
MRLFSFFGKKEGGEVRRKGSLLHSLYLKVFSLSLYVFDIISIVITSRSSLTITKLGCDRLKGEEEKKIK